MEPRIQYAQTKDGVSIAYCTLGEGAPIVLLSGIPWSHVQLEWQLLERRVIYQAVAQQAKLVQYDPRGMGSSARDVTDFSLDSWVLDLEAVVARLRLEQFALVGFVNSGPVAIAYAARYPERVSRLILWVTYARASDAYETPQGQSFRALRTQDWDIYTETTAHVLSGWSEGAFAHELAGFMRECIIQEKAVAAHAAIEEFDVTALLCEVRAPTLVLHHRDVRWPPVECSRALAAKIPEARLVVPEETPTIAAMVGAIGEFLREGQEPEAEAPAAASGLVTILFTDMESSTALTQSLGDAKAQELVRAHNAIVREALSAHGGSEIKHTGDGIMASFTTASSALASAVAIQTAVAARAEEQPEPPLGLRIGLNAGEPVAEEDDLFGTAVQLARRICDQAAPGQILASNVVRELAAGKQFLFADIGEVVPKGFEESMRLYEVRWREES